MTEKQLCSKEFQFMKMKYAVLKWCSLEPTDFFAFFSYVYVKV